MPQLRITMQGISLIVNRPAGSVVVFLAMGHGLKITHDFQRYQVPLGSDMFLAGGDRRPLDDAPTLRASSEYVVHLDHVAGNKVTLPAALADSRAHPADLNGRIFLSGGEFTGLPTAAFNGLLRNLNWTFLHTDTGRSHRQRITDTVVFTRELPPGNYYLLLPDGQSIAMDLTTPAGCDITLENEDKCDPPQETNLFELHEFPLLYAIAGIPGRTPTVTVRPEDQSRGIPRTSLKPTARNATTAIKESENPTGSGCDPVCLICQADG